MKTPILGENEIHLWCQRLDQSISPDFEKKNLKLLSEEEREKYGHFTVAQKKAEYLLTRTLVRRILSLYSGVLPQEWQFVPNAFGRPEISGPKLGLPLRFNLSHTMGFAVCAVGLNCELGVDVEYIRDTGDLLEIAKNHFSSIEFQTMKALSSHSQVQKFYEYWTLKEAYLKARGLGLSQLLTLDENPNAWQFKTIQVVQEYQLSVAIKTKPSFSNGFVEAKKIIKVMFKT